VIDAWADDLGDVERSKSFGVQFCCWVRQLEVCSFKPDLLSFSEWSEVALSLLSFGVFLSHGLCTVNGSLGTVSEGL
jgi:hypothetical protein